MKKIRTPLRKIIIFFCILLSSCNWLENKKEQAKQKINKTLDQQVYEPIREEVKEFTKDIFYPTYDSTLAAEHCAELRPPLLRPASLKDVSKIGYQYSVFLNTPDSLLSHIDASFFRPTEKFFPIRFPYSLVYSGETLDYFHLDINYCQYSDLSSPDKTYIYQEIFRLAIYNQYLAMITYDDDLSYMSPTKEGIKYHIINLDNNEHFKYLKQEDFEVDLQKRTQLNDTLLSNSDFIKWYKTYKPIG